ncbi:uncharacterized protein LOC62_02G003366 [Vanrija pseudolonga]|uniref:Uncharacterized protein n=1 Tax=Vanrija pseudolonga TaxID=143232 RepID=A0AAF0Y8F1_9TREE|nr:hypothetical protein LOC62_02G003366 [Vanrija pseudolonga]
MATMYDGLDASQIHALALGDGRKKAAEAIMNLGFSIWTPLCDPEVKAALKKAYNLYLSKAPPPTDYPTLSLTEFVGKYSEMAFKALEENLCRDIGLSAAVRKLPRLSPLFTSIPLVILDPLDINATPPATPELKPKRKAVPGPLRSYRYKPY